MNREKGAQQSRLGAPREANPGRVSHELWQRKQEIPSQ